MTLHTKTHRIACSYSTQMDATLLSWGVFSHLHLLGFMNASQYHMSLLPPEDQEVLFALPVVLRVNPNLGITAGDILELVNPLGLVFATTQATHSPIEAPVDAEGSATLGPLWKDHPYTLRELTAAQSHIVGTGPITLTQLPTVHGRWMSPREIAPFLTGARSIGAFQTRNPLHWGHLEIIKDMALAHDVLLLHPAMGPGLPDDIPAPIRAGAYETLLPHLPKNVLLSWAPIAMRLAGPREALWHAQIRFGFGATHFAVGRDHAGPGLHAPTGKPYYDPSSARTLALNLSGRLPIAIEGFSERVFDEHKGHFVPVESLTPGAPTRSISGTAFRAALRTGQADSLSWYMPKEELDWLSASVPKGRVILFTGLSASGKTTLARLLSERITQHTGQAPCHLDGDEARTHLTSELGFSREHRNLNVARLGFVACQVAKAGGVAIISAIAPYDEARQKIADMAKSQGIDFTLVYVDTPLDVCAQRDPKGLYKKAFAGLIPSFTGVSDPYEAPVPAHSTLTLCGTDNPYDLVQALFSQLFPVQKVSITH